MPERIIDLTRIIEPTAATAPRKFVVHIHDAWRKFRARCARRGSGMSCPTWHS